MSAARLVHSTRAAFSFLMPLVVKAEGFVAELVRFVFYAIVGAYLFSMVLPFAEYETGDALHGWQHVRTTLSVPLLWPSNFGFFVAAFLVGGGRYAGGAIVSLVATASMVGAAFINPRGGTAPWAGQLGAGYYLWVASGVALAIFAAVLWATQREEARA